ncbi:MAG: PBECR3 domain-containing polyvalent protein [Tumebacillaceae bacterium]
MTKPVVVGYLDQRVIDLFQLSLPPNTPIFAGETNISHMQNEHPDDFAKYGDKLPEILSSPDFVAKHPQKDSIEYIKIFQNEASGEYVLVAVRASKSNLLFARSLFVMTESKTQKYRDKGAFKKY